VKEEDFPEKYRPIIRRLKGAASNSEVKKQMKDDDEIFKYLRDCARIEANKLLKEKDKELEEKDKELEENKKEIEEKDKEIEEKDKLLEAMQKEIECLKANSNLKK
jgi:peptidoglycan hydrolase CwlO-like protein